MTDKSDTHRFIDRLGGINNAAERFNVSTRTVRRWCKRNSIPSKYLFPDWCLDSQMIEEPTPPPPPPPNPEPVQSVLDLAGTAMEIYPRRNGSPARREAIEKLTARLREGEDLNKIIAGTVRYRLYCEATGIVGTERVMQARRFYGVSREYLEPWDLPTKQPEKEDEKSLAEQLMESMNELE